MSDTLTPARRAALAVLELGARTDRPVFESNSTTDLLVADDDARLTVYWQTRQWLADSGLINQPLRGEGGRLTLTGPGETLARTVVAETVGS